MRRITKPMSLFGLMLQIEAENRRAEKNAGILLCLVFLAIDVMLIVDLLT